MGNRGARKESKSQQILRFLREHPYNAYFSNDIYEAMKGSGVKMRDVMSAVRTYDGLVYVRGYRSEDRQTPFREGYLLTWLDHDLSGEEAIQDDVESTDKACVHKVL